MKAIASPKVGLACSSCALWAELPTEGGEAGDGHEYVRMRKSMLLGEEEPPLNE